MISSFIIGILSLVVIILSYYLVKFKTLHGEERLRYATLKKQVTEEANLEKTNTAILTNSKELFLLKILRQLLENNPIGIINTTNGKMIRRTFEIKQLGKIECRRRTREKDGIRRVIVPVELAYEIKDTQHILTQKDLIKALSSRNIDEAINAIEKSVIVFHSADVETP